MKKCTKCGRYTLKERCPICGSATATASPPRFSPLDKYVKYRIIAKEESRSTTESSS
ncbi:MAG: RNA-protein complex protein Nop10 [Sulfolobales archaeon]|nr:RNA-protein complex protein Nop10 [Sulfolobales archaeon]MDW8083485.1 RNA-protein complex protein Nop10 [Sulfolobales archaeon]